MSRKILLFIIFSLGFFSQTYAQTLLVYGDDADSVEINASKDLLADYQKVSKEMVKLVKYSKLLPTTSFQNIIYIGTITSNSFISINQLQLFLTAL